MSYNPWCTKEKTNDKQKQCNSCNYWDIYWYEVIKEEEIKILCFSCYHEDTNNKSLKY